MPSSVRIMIVLLTPVLVSCGSDKKNDSPFAGPTAQSSASQCDAMWQTTMQVYNFSKYVIEEKTTQIESGETDVTISGMTVHERSDNAISLSFDDESSEGPAVTVTKEEICRNAFESEKESVQVDTYESTLDSRSVELERVPKTITVRAGTFDTEYVKTKTTYFVKATGEVTSEEIDETYTMGMVDVKSRYEDGQTIREVELIEYEP